MKTTKRLLAFALAALPMANMYGQMSFDYFSERWAEYQQHTESNLKSLHRNHFKDTIKVEEMKEAFFKYKDSRSHQSPYEGFDSVTWIGGYGKNVMLISPLERHPQKKVRECRGVWAWMGYYKLLDLQDENGVSQKQLLEKLNSDKDQKWLD